jgi:hypothetical protein
VAYDPSTPENEIAYEALDEVCAVGEVWADRHPALIAVSPERREEISKTLLDYMRRELAMKEGVARNQQEAVASLKSSLGYPPASGNLSQAEQPKSSDLSILIPFAIITAVVATVAVVLVATKEK